MADLSDIRRDYKLTGLDEKSIIQEPHRQFAQWMDEAIESQEFDVTAMVLSTVSSDLKPSSRVVLLKRYNENGFDFFSNYNSKKGKHIDSKPFGSLLFFWPLLERQIRVEGEIVKLSAEESDMYFHSRPKQSQVAAWASPQSDVIKNRKVLMDWFEEMDNIHQKKDIARPPHWGGYRLVPNLFEFWQGRENRLHDRIEYIKNANKWEIRRLAP